MQQMVAPKFVERFQQGAVAEGETVVLQCRAVGTPMPFLTWQKDGVSVENNPNIMVSLIYIRLKNKLFVLKSFIYVSRLENLIFKELHGTRN